MYNIMLCFIQYRYRVPSRIFQLGKGGGVQHQCHCTATHVTRGGRGGGGLCQYWLDWTSGECQACVTIHGCKIAYVHIQLAFEISVSLKISGGMIPPHRSWVGGGGQHPSPSLPPGRNLAVLCLVEPIRESECNVTFRPYSFYCVSEIAGVNE